MSVDRDRLRRLADAATPGPWAPYFNVHGDPYVAQEGRPKFGIVVSTTADDYGRADAEFMAAARDAVPALLDLLDRCETALADLPPHATVIKDVIGGGWMCATCSGRDPCRYARARAVLADLRASAAVAGSGR